MGREVENSILAAGTGASRLNHGENFGAITKAIAAADLSINVAEHAARMIVPRHEHENPYLCVVVDGALEVKSGTTFECPTGSVIVYPLGHVHANRFGTHAGRCINIHFGASWLDERDVLAWLSECRHVRVDACARSFSRLRAELDASDSAASLAIASAAIELIAEAMRAMPPARAADWLDDIVAIVEADLANAPTLTDLAATVGVHPSHVARAFRAHHGETLGAYVRRRRIEEADRMIVTTMRSLRDIAVDAGFADQAHFTRLYRRHFGAPPAARRRQRNRRSIDARAVQDATPSKR